MRQAHEMTGALRRRTLLLGAAAATLPAGGALAQTAPRPVRYVVAGPAGGSADIVARLFADEMGQVLGAPGIVDPKPGAAGMIAVNDLLQSPRDGQTVLVGVNSLVSEIPHIVKTRHDMFKDVVPLAELARGALVLVGSPDFAPRTLADIVAAAKRQPGKISYASYSAGTISHVLGQMLNSAAGIELTHVAYKGSTPALADVMGGHVHLMFDGMATSLPLIRAGKLKVYAVSTPRRSSLLPQVPTFAELGFEQLTVTGWMGLWGSAGLPEAAQASLRAAALKALQKPALRQRLQEAGFEPGEPRTQVEMAQGLRRDYDRVGAVLRSIDFKPE